MNDNKLPIVTGKVWCENVQRTNEAHVSFIMEEDFSLESSVENVISGVRRALIVSRVGLILAVH